MLKALVQIALRQRFVVVLAAAVFIVVGVASMRNAPMDVFPEFAPPLVEVQTEAPGMSSEAVESLITIPLESALNGIPDMEIIRSRSVQGLSSVVMLFKRGTDLFKVRQMVSERVSVAATGLPQQALTPKLMPPLSSTSRVLHIGLTPKSKDELKPGEPVLTQTDISVLMTWVIEPKLLSVPGVANVSTYGLQPKQFQILVKPAVLRDHGLTLDQVKKAVSDSVVHGSAGFHDSPNQRLAIQYTTIIKKPEDLARIVVAHRNGSPLLLEQVAEFKIGNPPYVGEGVVDDQKGLFVVVEKFPWGNTLDVTHKVEEALEALRPSLPGVKITTNIFRPATFIELALSNLTTAMMWGSILVALVLIVFLFEWRTSLISLTAIPLSIVAAIFILIQMEITINTMVLAGLAIAIGEVVDDAIIDVENIVRRLEQNRLLPEPKSAFHVVLHASLEVRSAVVYASFIVVFVCLSIFFMSGVAGSFFRPLALAYILAIMASLVVALLVTPAMCLIFLPKVFAKRKESPVIRGIRWAYRSFLPLVLRFPLVLVGLLAFLVVGAFLLFTDLKEEYLPQFQENDFLMHWIAKPGTNIDVVTDDIISVGKDMLKETPVQGFGAHIARADEVGEEVVGPHFAELWVSLGDYDGDYQQARHDIEKVMSRHPGFQHDLLTYLQERIKEVLTGTGATVVLRIYGPDLEKLRHKAQMVKQLIAQGPNDEGMVEGVVDLKVESQVLVPQIELAFHPYKAEKYGLKPKQIADSVTTLMNGSVVGEVHQDQKKFSVVVWAHPDVRATWADLNKMDIDLPSGLGTVPLEAVAELQLVNAPNKIRREQASRCIDVTCNIKDRDLGSVVKDIQKRVDHLPQEQEYRVEFLGEYQARTENQRQLLWVSLFAILGIGVLLFIDFQSLRLTLLVLLALPFALIGGIVAAYLTGGVLSLGSLVGFITVFGIAARNSIMLISHYRHLQREEGMKFDRELIMRGATERVAPILMTALTAALGLLPLALSGNKPGYEVEYPMAVVILGGLITSTVLNLLVLPAFYQWFGKAEENLQTAE